MATYSSPVSELLTIGRPTGDVGDADYSKYGIGTEHVPELIRLVQDQELALGDSESPVVYAQIHAWRALGQLRAEAAVESLLDLLAAQGDDADWNDWTTEEVPRVLGLLGPAAIPATVARLERRGREEWPSVYFAGALTEIAKRHPETRAEVVRELSRVLDTARDNDPGANGSVIADLLDLKAAEAWPVIEQAFATGNVDAGVAGDAAAVKWELGLGPKPPSRTFPPPRAGYLPTAKERAEARAKARKAEKKVRKKRKGK